MKKVMDESVLWWFGNIERKENSRTAKMIYKGEWYGNYLVGGVTQ